MSFRLTVDGQLWTEQLARTAGEYPGLVPVVKGNGYGFGNARLAQRCTALGVDTVAVGTWAEARAVRPYFAGLLLVMAPLTSGELAEQPTGRGVLRTVAHAEVVEQLAAAASVNPADPANPIVLELDSPVHRHGIPVRGLGELAPALGRLPLAGLALHLPAGGDRRQVIPEAAEQLRAARRAGVEAGTLWLSHLDAAELAALQRHVPWARLRIRMGTRLWLGDRSAFTATGTVLDTHRVPRRQLIGYRQRRCPDGTIIVVSGGTAHGVGLQASASQGTWRGLVRGALAGAAHGAGVSHSPFSWRGRRLRYADVPHMQVSMLLVPPGVEVPALGERLACDVRMTVTTFDEVDLEDPPSARPAGQPAARRPAA